MKIPTFNWKPPKSFTDEDTLFEMSSGSFYTWHACKTCVMYSVFLAAVAIYFQWWWVVPFLTFIGLVASSVAGTIERKASKGYPYMEPGDAMGIVFSAFLYLICCVALFVWSFSMPTDGWDGIFTGPSSSEFSTSVDPGGSTD